MSTLTGRYISSTETAMDHDLRRIKEKSFLVYLSEVEQTLSDTFWNVELVFWASACREARDSLFNEGSKFSNLITTIGDVHHIFPKQYLIDNGIKDKAKYNQVANFTYLDTPTNIAVGKEKPSVYFSNVWKQISSGDYVIGNLKTEEAYNKNLSDNCIPTGIINWTHENYEEFLLQRRKLMAMKIREYYEKL